MKLLSMDRSSLVFFYELKKDAIEKYLVMEILSERVWVFSPVGGVLNRSKIVYSISLISIFSAKKDGETPNCFLNNLLKYKESS